MFEDGQISTVQPSQEEGRNGVVRGGLIRCEKMITRQRGYGGQRVGAKVSAPPHGCITYYNIRIKTQGDYLKQMGANGRLSQFDTSGKFLNIMVSADVCRLKGKTMRKRDSEGQRNEYCNISSS